MGRAPDCALNRAWKCADRGAIDPDHCSGIVVNSNTISHNFIHLPFFRSGGANRLYSFYLTLVLGFPTVGGGNGIWRITPDLRFEFV